MILEIINKWNSNKNLLENRFKSHKIDDNLSYTLIVKYIIESILNEPEKLYDESKITIIDDGDYQGTQIFIIPKDTYQPDIDDYLITHTYYGSCSGCDTLQAILENYDCSIEDTENLFLSTEQVSDLMTLSLHLIQKMKYLSGNQIQLT